MLLVQGVIQQFRSQAPLLQLVSSQIKVPVSQIKNINVVRRSVDARKRRGRSSGLNDIRLVYNIQVELLDKSLEQRILNNPDSRAKIVEEFEPYRPKWHSTDSAVMKSGSSRPVVIGSGPAGLFAAYTLACSGFRPIIVEMGPKVERRASDLMKFWKKNILTTNSNGVFGEGGAGAFSDGKLTTRSSSIYHRFVHETLIQHGAKPNILYESRAHVGTEELRKIITNFSRDAIRAKGGTFLYNTAVTGFTIRDSRVCEVEVEGMPLASETEREESLQAFLDISNGDVVVLPDDVTPSSTVVPPKFKIRSTDFFLGTGHSSRSIFQLLHDNGVKLSPKDFAIGLRLQISQKYINSIQYGESDTSVPSSSQSLSPTSAPDENRIPPHKELGPAEFTLKYFDNETQRSVYTFCMCPGGVIVNASHGNNEVAVNGMSYSKRASRYANAAFVVTVNTKDFQSLARELNSATNNGHEVVHENDPLIGMKFQQFWEQKCFEVGNNDYTAPAQRVVDFIRLADKSETIDQQDDSNALPDHLFMGKLRSADLHQVLPSYVCKALVNALKSFSKSIPGLVDPSALLVGIESRTSSPVRIDRDKITLESVNTKGLYPIGEGAGYAGGIMTACVDGVRAAEAMIANREGTLDKLPSFSSLENNSMTTW
jgi:uncharacterized FAD-dependent dehydrogenase